MTTIRQYYWNDPGAPRVSYSANSFNDVLRACLVSGYGNKEGAGWTEVFTSGTRRLFQCPGGNQRVYEFNDANSSYVYFRGYGSLDPVTGSDGVDAFPTTGQSANGYSIVKTTSTGTTTYRPWSIIVSDRSLYFQIFYNHTQEEESTTEVSTGFVGDFVSYIPGDVGNSMVYGMASAATAANSQFFGDDLSFTAPRSGIAVFRDYLQMQNSFTNLSIAPGWLANSTSIGNVGFSFPEVGSGGLILDPVRIIEYTDGTSASRLLRGHLPGLFNPIHNNPGVHRGTFDGSGVLSGTKTVLWKKGRTLSKMAFTDNTSDWL